MMPWLEPGHHPDGVTLTQAERGDPFHPVGMTVGGTSRETLAVKVSGTTDPQVERIDALFVQSATAFSSDGGTITLHGVADSTVYFADRPRREIGHIPTRRFVELWDTGANSFAIDPPNAVLSFLDDNGGAPEDAVVVLREPRLEDGTLSYSVEVLEGTLPRSSGPCTLFIDVFGRPLAPAWGAGEQRRGLAKPQSARRTKATVLRRR